MIEIRRENNVLVYKNDNETKPLLDCNNFLENKSRIPLHSENNEMTLPLYLSNLLQTYSNLFEEGHAPNDALDLFLIDSLLSAQLIKTALPVKVLELGCSNGRLSYHLASIIGKFHEQSTLCCVCDSIGNGSNNYWLDMISLVEQAPKLSLLASDYDDTNLADHNFDIVIINGSVLLKQAYSIVKEAQRLIKKDGIIICYAWQQPHLALCFQQAHTLVDIYPTDATSSVLVAKGSAIISITDTLAEWKKEAENDLANAEYALLSSCDKDQLMTYIKKLNHHADTATSNMIIDIKVRVLALKEKLLVQYVNMK